MSGRGTPKSYRRHWPTDYSSHELLFTPDGPLYGAVGQGLALGAPMLVMNDMPWNALSDFGNEKIQAQQRKILEDVWGITTRERWVEVINTLLDTNYGAADSYWALALRQRALTRHDTAVVDDQTWAAEIAAYCAESSTPEWSAKVQSTIPAIHTVEARLREIRFLGADEVVVGADAYDYARAVAVARWGIRAGWGAPHVVANVATAAAEAVAGTYRSWREYGIGFNAGRMLTYPDTWGKQDYQAVAPVLQLLGARVSPWNNLPFPEAG